MKKKSKPNYDMMYESAIISTQLAYKDYAKLMVAYYSTTGINSQGEFYVIGNADEVKQKIKNAYAKYQERLKEQNTIKILRDEWKGEK